MSEPLASYTFLPWLRQGIVSKIGQPDTLGAGAGPGERAAVAISLQVGGDPNFVSDDVQLVGPGDIVGISPRAVVRTEPRHWVTDFEPNYLAFIEFYDEDFPWRYTPARAVEVDGTGAPVSDPQRTKLRPWLFLMVLAEDEFEPVQTLSAPLPAVRLISAASPAAIFPPPNQAWAWAHVHVSQDVTANSTRTAPQTVDALQDLLQQNPDHALSRLVCPRKLRPETAYHAFVVPAFEVGRLAGLGQPNTGQGALAPSWGAGQVEYPVYYRWYFRTGMRGDFEYLVNLLEPRRADPRVGVRDMDMQVPDFGVRGMRDGPNEEPVMGLEGALKSPEAVPHPVIWPPADPADYPPFLQELQALINLQDALLHPPEGEEGHPDPVISPPLYGRWHALQRRLHVDQSGWVNELNRDPRNRVPAGFGTLVVQTNQEDYMRRAWEQLGEVLAANQKIRQAQLSLVAIHRIHARYLLPLNVDQQVVVAQAVHTRVAGSDTTLFQQVKRSRLPQAALSPTFRRITRPRGPVVRRVAPESDGQPSDLLVRLNEGEITAAPPKAPPEGQSSLDEITDDLVPDWLPDWLRRPLIRRLARLLLLLLLRLVSLLRLGGPVTQFLRNLLDALDAVPASERLKEGRLTPEAVDQVPPRPNFVVTEPGDELAQDIDRVGDQDSPEAANLRTALRDVHDRLQTPLPEPPERPPLDLSNTGLKLVQALDPVYAVPKRVRGIVAIPPTFRYLRPLETIVPVMAHPVFTDPMYKPLRDISSELLIPNLQLITNNTITLLETNPEFIEAYMVGLNHEMARELLWREYVTDQRGSPFRQFWDVAEMVDRAGTDPKALEEARRDIKALHEWDRSTSLGTHENRPLPTGGEEEESRLVLVIRGDLLKKYPTAVIYAQEARWVDDPDHPGRKIRVLDERDPAQNRLEPIFKAAIEPDVHFLGFDLTQSMAKGDTTPPADGEEGTPGYFFVIQERPGEPRFGLDIEDATPPTPTSWNELAWNHLGDPETIGLIDLTAVPTTNITATPDSEIAWGSNAADMAYILYQVPVMVAVHAADMLR